jgi:hypothetical protein
MQREGENKWVHLDEMDDSDEVFGPFDTEDQAIEFGENIFGFDGNWSERLIQPLDGGRVQQLIDDQERGSW